MSSDTSTLHKEAKQAFNELNADHERLERLVATAEKRLREARRGDEVAMKTAALELAGLREALGDVTSERDDAREHLAEVEQRAQIEADEAELQKIRRKLDRLTKDAAQALNAAADAALASVQHAAKAEQEARGLHGRMSELLERLGQPSPRRFTPAGVRQALAIRQNPLPEDEPLLHALVAAAQTHPVARGATRVTLTSERSERHDQARLLTAQRAWDARAQIVDRWNRSDLPAEQVDQAKAYADWIAKHPRPESLDDVEAAA